MAAFLRSSALKAARSLAAAPQAARVAPLASLGAQAVRAFQASSRLGQAEAAAVELPGNLEFDAQAMKLINEAEVESNTIDVTTPRPKALPVLDLMTGQAIPGAEIPLDPRIFHAPIRPDIVHRVVVWQEKNARTTLYKAKSRAEVAGGGAKPWRQKGTGRARAGSNTSPIWVGGGKAHGPVFRDWSIKLPKKIRRLGLRISLSAKVLDGRLIVVDSLEGLLPPAAAAAAEGAAPAAAGEAGIVKTKAVIAALERLGLDSRKAPVVLVDAPDLPDPVKRACWNLPRFRALPGVGTNVKDVVWAGHLVVTRAGMDYLTAFLGQDV